MIPPAKFSIAVNAENFKKVQTELFKLGHTWIHGSAFTETWEKVWGGYFINCDDGEVLYVYPRAEFSIITLEDLTDDPSPNIMEALL